MGGASKLYYNDSTNRVGIGDVPSPTQQLHVSGTAYVTSNITGDGKLYIGNPTSVSTTGSYVRYNSATNEYEYTDATILGPTGPAGSNGSDGAAGALVLRANWTCW